MCGMRVLQRAALLSSLQPAQPDASHVTDSHKHVASHVSGSCRTDR